MRCLRRRRGRTPTVLGKGKQLFGDTGTTKALELVESRPVGPDGVLVRVHWSGTPITPVPPARHLLRAKDLDGRPLPRAARRARARPLGAARRRRTSAGSSPAPSAKTPHQYLLHRRLQRAAELLRNTDRSVADICFTVGLKSVGSFTTSFGREFGISPTAYRAKSPAGLCSRAVFLMCVLLVWTRDPRQQFWRRQRRRPCRARGRTLLPKRPREDDDVEEPDERERVGAGPGRGACLLHREARPRASRRRDGAGDGQLPVADGRGTRAEGREHRPHGRARPARLRRGDVVEARGPRCQGRCRWAVLRHRRRRRHVSGAAGSRGRVLTEPTDQPYGRDAGFRDPSGNQMRMAKLGD